MSKTNFKTTRFILKGVFILMISLQTCFANEFVVDHKTISYTDTGSGKPVVLIHAFPTDQQLWKQQIEPLKKHFRVITLDLWGFGQSAPTDGKAITMTQYADEVNTLLTHLQIQHAIIGGESMGGYIALAFLNKYPQKVAGLILADTQPIADNADTKKKRETSAQDVLQHGTENLITGFIPKALSPQASEEIKLSLYKLMQKQSAKGIASALRGMALRQDMSGTLAATSLPVLIITGEEDNVISPQQSHDMHALSKNSTLVVIKNAGHLSNLEQEEKWDKAVIEMFG
ncbi:MAG: lip3 [Gammaproteobacteria bacterium]|jgi:pimeloyl-ACP methyl ester carboxylesterase|nr:lip3 [Gammaproteobacteria bacterium]